jgi:uncharacterized membrane protein YqjE
MERNVDVRFRDGSDGQPAEELSVGQLVGRVTGDLSQLFRQELDLAKTEIKEEVARAGKGAGMLSGAGVAGLYGLMLLSFAAAWGLAEVVARGVAFLLVGVAWLLVALVLFLTGRRQLAKAQPFPPQQTVETLKEDVQWAKEQMT